ncbi:unnamed protein product [Schistocephalus solidus]|uniref:Progestin and adipoQ receptor family member 8 n=1 Tax=Schistocephalus solidus TaxID=70667 RepID=A0A183T9T1_SCHSO|nr:unnamed protein product [Schistocephalus solidus]
MNGYRPPSSWKQCMSSLFYLHNESFNAWTHIVPIPIFLYIFLSEIFFGKPNIALSVYLFSVLCFLMGSSFAHTFCCQTSLSKDAFFIVDYIGLGIFSHGSGIAYVTFAMPLEFHSLNCFPVTSPAILLTALSCVLSMWGVFHFFRHILRLASFAVPGLLISIPVLFKVYSCYVPRQYPNGYCESSVFWSLQMLSCCAAVVFYLSRIPERFYPGKFDVIGHSHNFFHIFSLFGLYYQYQAILLDKRFHSSLSHVPSLHVVPIISILLLCLMSFYTIFYFRDLLFKEKSKKF